MHPRFTASYTVEGTITPLQLYSVSTQPVSPSEEQLVCTLANSQVYVFTLSNTDILRADEMNFELLSQAFHAGVVTGLEDANVELLGRAVEELLAREVVLVSIK